MSFAFNPFTGALDVVDRQDHHSAWYHIQSDRSVTIKEHKQMYVFGGLLEVDGTLLIEGQVEVAE